MNSTGKQRELPKRKQCYRAKEAAAVFEYTRTFIYPYTIAFFNWEFRVNHVYGSYGVFPLQSLTYNLQFTLLFNFVTFTARFMGKPPRWV